MMLSDDGFILRHCLDTVFISHNKEYFIFCHQPRKYVPIMQFLFSVAMETPSNQLIFMHCINVNFLLLN